MRGGGVREVGCGRWVRGGCIMSTRGTLTSHSKVEWLTGVCCALSTGGQELGRCGHKENVRTGAANCLTSQKLKYHATRYKTCKYITS